MSNKLVNAGGAVGAVSTASTLATCAKEVMCAREERKTVEAACDLKVDLARIDLTRDMAMLSCNLRRFDRLMDAYEAEPDPQLRDRLLVAATGIAAGRGPASLALIGEDDR